MHMTGGRDIALTGVPRSGTTLACHLLGRATDTLALFEPMPVEQLSLDRANALGEIESFFQSARQRAITQGRVPSKHRDGRVPDNPIGAHADPCHGRPWLAEHGELNVDKPLNEQFTLVVKHNAAFTALLPQLADRFEVYAIVRNPLAVLASWHSVNLPVSHGRLPAGERLDPDLGQALHSEDDLLARQIHILDWFFSRYAATLETDRVIRYEDMVASRGQCLFATTRVPGLPDASPLASRNASNQYQTSRAPMLAQALCRHGGAYLRYYARDDILDLAACMQET